MGMFDMFKMMGKLNEVKDDVKNVKDELKNIEVMGHDKAELVKVVMTADKNIKSIDLDQASLFPEKKVEMESAIAEAMEMAMKSATQVSKDLIQKTIGDKYPEIAGMDIGKFFG